MAYMFSKSHLYDFTHEPSSIVGFSSGIKNSFNDFVKENYSVLPEI